MVNASVVQHPEVTLIGEMIITEDTFLDTLADLEDTTCKNLSDALASVAEAVSGEAESFVPKPLVEATIGAIDEALGKLGEIIGEPGAEAFCPEERKVLEEAAFWGGKETPPLAGSTSQPVTPTVLESTPGSGKAESPRKFPNPMDAAKPKAAAKCKSTACAKAKAAAERKSTARAKAKAAAKCKSTARAKAKAAAKRKSTARAKAKAAAKRKSTARAKAKAAAKSKSMRRAKKAGEASKDQGSGECEQAQALDQDLKKKLHSATRFKTENEHEHKRFKEAKIGGTLTACTLNI